MFYDILASKFPSQRKKKKLNKNKNLPPNHKISEKKDANHFFPWPCANLVSN